MPRFRMASDEEAAALRPQLATERGLHWAQAYTRFPTNMGKLLLSRPAYGGPFLELFQRLMWDAGPLTRQQREMVALVVSRANRCQY